MFYNTGNVVFRDELPMIEPKRIAQSETYVHVPYNEIVTVAEEAANAFWQDLKKVETEFRINAGGTAFAGMLYYQYPEQPEISRFIGMLSSTDKKLAVRYAVGEAVTVCLNGLIIGDFVVTRRHTKNVYQDLEEKCWLAMEKGQEKIEFMKHFKDGLRDLRTSADDFAGYVGQLWLGKMLSPKNINWLQNNWSPETETIANYDLGTAWGHYGAITEAIQHGHGNPTNTLKQFAEIEQFTAHYFELEVT